MKNLIEVLFQFKDVGSEAIDQNREKLALMAKEIEETAKQADFIVESQKKMDKAIKDSSKVNDEAVKEAKRIAKEKEKIAKEEEKRIKEAAKEQIRIEKEKAQLAKNAANEEKRIAKEQAAVAKEKARLEKTAAAEQLRISKELDKQEKARLAEQKRISKEQENLTKQEVNQQKALAKQQAALAKEEARIRKEKDIAEKNALVQQLRINREKQQAEKAALLAANKAAREQEKAAQQAIKSQRQLAAEQNKVLQAQKKTSSASADVNNAEKNVGLLGKANQQMASSVKNLNLIKLGIGAAAAAAVAAVVIFARNAADEFYKMRLAAETTGIDVRVLQEYKNVLDDVGISTDQFAGKLRDLNERFMEAFRAGTGEAVDILKTLGVEAEEFSKLNPEEQFVKLYEVTKDLNEQQKLEFFNKLGLDNLNLVFNRMDQIEKKKEEIQRTGLVITDEEAGRLKEFENSWNGFTNNLKTFSTIIYSSLIPATQDAFDGIFGGFEMSRDGASMFSMFLIEIVQFFAKIGNVGRLAFDMLTNKLSSMSLYAEQAGSGIKFLFDNMSVSIAGIVEKLKAIDIGVAIADLSKKTFSGIIDVVFDALDSMTRGIQRIAQSISGVIPDAILNQLDSARSSIKSAREGLYKYEMSEEQKLNEEKSKLIDQDTENKKKKIEADYKENQKIRKKELADLENESLANVAAFNKRADNINSKTSDQYVLTVAEATKKREEEKKAIKKTLKEEEETNNEIDKLLEEVEIIKNKMALGILKNTETNTSYTIQDILDKYQEAIDLASKDNKNIGKELSIRRKKRDEEIAFIDEQNQKSIKTIKDRIDNLKIINEIGSENFNENKDLIIASYNEMIALAEKQGKTELEINQIISERNQYQDTFVQQQKEINGKLIELENSLLEAQGKNDIIRQRRREAELKAVNELFKNATDEQKANAISMTNALFDIEEAKERLSEIDQEIENLIDKRDNKTDIFDRSEILRLEEEINKKLIERGELEEELGIKRDEGNKKFFLTLGQVKDILNETYSNLSTLITSSLTGVNSLSDAVKNFFNSTLQYIAKMLQQMIVMESLKFVGNFFGFSSLGGASASSLPGFAVGGSVSSAGGTGIFGAMGSLKSGEVNAILHDGEAVLTEEHQNNLGNALSSMGTSVNNNINVMIDKSSLAAEMGSTNEFKQAVQMAVKSDRATYKQLVS